MATEKLSYCLCYRPSTRYTWCTTKRPPVMWLVTSSTFSVSWPKCWRSPISTSVPRSVSLCWILSVWWQCSAVLGNILAPEPRIFMLEASMLSLKIPINCSHQSVLVHSWGIWFKVESQDIATVKKTVNSFLCEVLFSVGLLKSKFLDHLGVTVWDGKRTVNKLRLARCRRQSQIG